MSGRCFLASSVGEFLLAFWGTRAAIEMAAASRRRRVETFTTAQARLRTATHRMRSWRWASLSTSSAEWSAFVNGFLLQHCRTFDDSEENRLEWHTLHLEFCSQLEALLEQQLSILGVAVDDFVELLGEKPRENYDAFLEAVLAIDDFGRFKAAMLDLKRDLLGYYAACRHDRSRQRRMDNPAHWACRLLARVFTDVSWQRRSQNTYRLFANCVIGFNCVA